jgi:hypothetical protein
MDGAAKLVLAALIAFASPQEPATLLERVRERALADLTATPNYVCVDTIERWRRMPTERAFRLLDRVRLELAHVDGSDHFSRLGEAGFQAKGPSAIVGYGAAVRGDFADNRALIFRNSATEVRYVGLEPVDGKTAARFDYQVPLGRGGLTIKVESASGVAGARGSFWADPNTLDLVRLDVEGYAFPADVPVRAVAFRTRYFRAAVGDRAVLLARDSELLLTLPDGTVKRNFSVFSNCREFQAQSAISFEAGTNARMEQAPAIEAARLPAGLELTIALDTAVDLETATVGDEVRAHVVEEVGPVPRGARIVGRIERLIRYHETYVLIGLSFSRVEFRRIRAPFAARLIDAGSGEIRSFGYFADNDLVRYDPPGTASLYLGDRPRLRRGFSMRWLTVDPARR